MLHDIRWTSEKLRQRLSLIGPSIYSRRLPLPPFRLLKLESPDEDPPIEPNLNDEGWEIVQPNSYWIGPQVNFVLRTHFQVPLDWLAAVNVALHLPLGEAGDFSHPEALVHVDGAPIGGCDRHHQEILLPSRWIDGDIHSLALHGWSGGTGVDPAVMLLMRECALVQIDKPLREFIVLARITLDVADHLDNDNPTRAHLFNALDEAFHLLDTREPLGRSFYASVPLANAYLRAKIASSGPPLDVDIIAAGHAHIDLAWLWTLGQTRRKAGRTFYNVINLMERFPNFRFTQSQPQLYEFVRQDYPELFKAIQSRVAEGQWEPIGGMWVEADCNLSGGEALVRQFLLGRTYFRQHFGEGAESPVLWLPDVFGYAWCLPQLIKEAGLDYFFTIKIGWSQYNRFPYDSFWWQGLDGTRILTHFSPTKEPGSAMASTYNSKASPGEVLSTWTNFQQKDWGKSGQTPPLLMSYGFGNGGGGPTREMVDNVHELNSFPAMPRTRFGTVAEFFSQLESKAGHRLPTWNGELYLEYHRGTYTTQARNKRANRKSEVFLHNVEFLATLAATLDERYRYPGSELRRAWELVCLNQFHDIIPGSSIGEVYTESLEQYAEVKRIGDKLCNAALALIAQFTIPDLNISERTKDSLVPTTSELDDVRYVLLVNPTSWSRCDLVFWPGREKKNRAWRKPDTSPVTGQSTEGGLLLDIGCLGPYSLTFLTTDSEHPDIDMTESTTREVAAPGASTSSLENNYLLVEFNKDGDITRIYDKEARREVVPSNELANQFQLFEDRPKSPDAWEIDIYYEDKMWLAEPAESIVVVENGPLRAAVEIRRHVSHSTLVQRISLAHNSPRLDFDTVIHWHEKHMLLKVAFPVAILSPSATYEIQWGNVQRPTHRNTSWDWARFETCAHKWVDLSEGGYGVSLLNDCKYGHDIHENVIRLTLLRATTNPDPEADQGEHHFVYSLLPHEGSWGELTMAEAYMLNDPVIVYVPNSSSKDSTHSKKIADSIQRPFIIVDTPNVVVETIKGAEDGRGIIVRLYESQRIRGPVTLTTSFPLADAWQTNLLEENQEQLAIDGNQLHLTIRPYQIITLRLLPEDKLSW